jgi:hypothetical protein
MKRAKHDEKVAANEGKKFTTLFNNKKAQCAEWKRAFNTATSNL